jgi:hypothetical protein
MKRFAIDVITKQFSKRGEDICGDATKVVRTHDSTIIVVSDGLGSGVKANVLATLTVELACGLFRGELSLHVIVETLVATLPVCKWRNIAYSTFAIIKIYDNGMVTSVEYDSPGMILVRNGGKVENITGSEIQIGEKVITESHFRLQPNDMLLFFSDGIVYAGVGAGLPMGWQEEGILDYVGKLGSFLYGDCVQLAEMVSQRALSYWGSHPGDDGTVLCARYRRGKNATVLTGPPADRALVHPMIHDFLSRKGKKIVSGGTTSHLVADYLKKEMVMDETLIDTDLPPSAHIKGIDLVTEGILTLSRTTEYLKNGVPQGRIDAATKLLRSLMDADGITFIVGTARNPAHQNTGLPDSILIRRTIVEELAAKLREDGKETELVYY